MKAEYLGNGHWRYTGLQVKAGDKIPTGPPEQICAVDGHAWSGFGPFISCQRCSKKWPRNGIDVKIHIGSHFDKRSHYVQDGRRLAGIKMRWP